MEEIKQTLADKAKSFPQLKGEFKGLRKFRIGNYRVIYAIEDGDVVILKIGHRKDIYK
ncbi:MAG: type II toxin-antitoxin system mRNA interferase toxin, RelE/StbE family [Chlorobi bacterium]|nr:type II toxin-antitoxin system mRNA interferase toxin, RelE/StbE family [Chlorobiota bacterium]MCI0717314.1 type II toxin-antitoxin system mRNA interferase toxin, RelE/StbE family [Chlorobiota bacterium]